MNQPYGGSLPDLYRCDCCLDFGCWMKLVDQADTDHPASLVDLHHGKWVCTECIAAHITAENEQDAQPNPEFCERRRDLHHLTHTIIGVRDQSPPPQKQKRERTTNAGEGFIGGNAGFVAVERDLPQVKHRLGPGVLPIPTQEPGPAVPSRFPPPEILPPPPPKKLRTTKD